MNTAKERETFYDEEIAPTLLELGRKCEDAGLSFVARVEWATDEAGTTSTLREEAGMGTLMTYWASYSDGNADTLIMAMQRYAKKYGHGSICLRLLGVPTSPGEDNE